MLYLAIKSSAPAAVRRSCSAKQAAKTRRLNVRAVARSARAARRAAEHTAAPAVIIMEYIAPVVVAAPAPAVALLCADNRAARRMEHIARMERRRSADVAHNAALYANPVLYRRAWLCTSEGVHYYKGLADSAPTQKFTLVTPASVLGRNAEGRYISIPVAGPAVLKPVHDIVEYSRPQSKAAALAAVYIPSNHAGILAAASIPAPEYGSSSAAKSAVQTRQYGDIQTLAIRATISAIKLAIAPRARFVDVAVIDESTAIIDGNAVEVETLESADGDNRGSYTATLKNALASLQVYAHSGTAAYPDNADAADLLSVATLAILESARRVGVDAETWASGYNADGLPFVRVIDVTRGGHNQQAGRIITGYRAVFATVTAAVNSAIRGERTRQDSKISVDAVSMASDTQAPARFDAPDVYSMDAAAAWELSDTIAATIRAAAKSEDAAAIDVHICAMLTAGYTQKQIADSMGRTQSYIAKRVAAIRSTLSVLL